MSDAVKPLSKIKMDLESGYPEESLRRMIEQGTTGEIKKDLDRLLSLARSGKGRRRKI